MDKIVRFSSQFNGSNSSGFRGTSLAAILLLATSISNILLIPQTVKPNQPSQARVNKPFDLALRRFEAFVNLQMAKDKIPGLTIGFKKDNVTWVKGFGYADLENKIPANENSAYRLASITKTMTGVAILQLVERGKMSLDAEIQTYLPSYPKQKWPVTVRQLLVHLGGGQTGSGIGPEYVTPREVVARIAKYPIKNEPGTKFDYQTSGYNLLGAAIEEVSGKSFGDYVRENVWQPVGMQNTRMDNVRDLIPNRVRGYEVVKGEIKNAPFLDVSSRFGGGGANGTVHDLLRWASNIQTAGIMSRASLDLMFTPVANKSGHYVGIDEDTWHYTLGWQVFPVNGQFVFYNDGGQSGTNTMVLHIPSENLSIAFACNVQDIDRMPYVKRLYEAVTDQPWDIRVYTQNSSDGAIYRGMSETFNFGSLYYDQFKRPETSDGEALKKAFAYFNQNVNRAALQTAFAPVSTAIADGRHPVAGTPLLKVGSHMAMKLREKYGPAHVKKYQRLGAIPFFADYIEMYKATADYSEDLRFTAEFETLIKKWNQDWSRTWNDYTMHFGSTAAPVDLKSVEVRLSGLFAGAEVYPNLIGNLLEIRRSYEPKKDWIQAARAAKIAAELYPQSDTTNGYYAISLILVGNSAEAKIALKKAASINPNGIAGPGAANQIAMGIAAINESRAIEWLKVAIDLYPKEPALYVRLGEFYLKREQRDSAIEAFKKALEIDSKYEPAIEALRKTTS